MNRTRASSDIEAVVTTRERGRGRRAIQAKAANSDFRLEPPPPVLPCQNERRAEPKMERVDNGSERRIRSGTAFSSYPVSRRPQFHVYARDEYG